MVTAEEDIGYLIKIVQKDLEIAGNRKLIESTPARIAEIDRKIAEIEEGAGEFRLKVKEMEDERKRLEKDIGEQRKAKTEKEAKFVGTRYKNQKEYDAAKREVEILVDKIYKEEERVLELMELLAVDSVKLAEAEAKAAAGKEALVSEKNELEGRLAEAREGLQSLEEDKLRILPGLSEGVRRMYERILAVKGDSGVANLIDDICQGCRSRIPLQKAVEVRRNDRILTCEVCGRILVHYDKD